MKKSFNKPIPIYQELRSGAVQDIMKYRAHWIVQWGTVVFSIFFLVLLAVTFFIDFPDIVKSTLTLTSSSIPKAVVAKIPGKIEKLFIKEKSLVAQNQVLAYLESTANHDDVIAFYNKLKQLQTSINQGNYGALTSFKKGTLINLGELQPDFQQFEQSLTQLQSLTSSGFYSQKEAILRQEIQRLRYLAQKTLEQRALYQKDVHLAEKEFLANQRMARQGIISSMELSREESKLLSKQLPLKQIEGSLISNQSEQSAKEKELLEMKKDLFERKKFSFEGLETFLSAIESWKSKYIITAPAAGYVFFQNSVQENQSISANQELFYIGTKDKRNYIGELRVPQDNFGKLKLNQRVIIRFSGYPPEEFGEVDGKIISIAEIPDKDNTYLTKIVLPNGLITNYKKQLTFKNGMIGSADIITEEHALSDKILAQFRKAVVSQ